MIRLAFSAAALACATGAAATAGAAQPQPYGALGPQGGPPPAAVTEQSAPDAVLSTQTPAAAAAVTSGATATGQPIPYSTLVAQGGGTTAAMAPVSDSPLAAALQAVRRGDVNGAQAQASALTDPVARKVVTWALVDQAGAMLSLPQILAADRDLQGWPRETRRRAVVERALALGAPSPTQTIAWFDGREPQTGDGAYALAVALQAQGRQADAVALVRHFWRERSFEADTQARMQARFAGVLSAEDTDRRLENLLYTSNGPALRALTAVVDADHQQLAAARLALRANSSEAPALVAALPASVQNDGGLAFDRARYYRKHNLDVMAVGFLRTTTADPPGPDAAAAVWNERRALMTAALKAGDAQGAYAAASAHGLAPGVDYSEAEFFAGWIALTRLHDPALADRHFAAVQQQGATPTTLSRALYWRGRAAQMRGDAAAAQGFWRDGGAYYTSFYGQLAAEKAGVRTLSLAPDPQPTAADRNQFDGRETVRAARLLSDAGQKELFSTFVLSTAEDVNSPEEAAMLVDLARASGAPGIATRAARVAITRGFYLPQRGWPLLPAPTGAGRPEPAFTLSIVRQESGFDPAIRSGAGARGLMQLMPATAALVARREGVDYAASRLDDPDYNMRLGASYLGGLTGDFSGSYVLAAAGYNAGPGRAAQWASDCGDPRQSSVDPADFIECIPFSETRNYVMRVMESVGVYRARLNGGSAPLTILADLHRGGYAPSGAALQTAAVAAPTPLR
ncbi:MAG: lytic transglycosylase domain-containing protein [Caulobacteraceae bacterium]|nr:lytic transglycosylase domain-containing protein [Caulobacter sp.]